MGLRFPTAAAVSVIFFTALYARSADGVTRTCPSPTDMLYEVKDNDTLSEIAARAYCLSSDPGITNAWKTLAEYNRIPIGSNPHKIYTLTDLCLPQHIEVAAWGADRCIAPDVMGAAPVKATCGDGKREGREICDGRDLGGMTCEGMGLSPGPLTCRGDCSSFDASACAPKAPAPQCPPPEAEKEPCPCDMKDASSEPLLRRVVVGVGAGFAVPLVGATRDTIHSAVFVAEASARLTLRWLEVTPRALFVAGAHDIIFNDIDQPQTLIGGGGALSLGAPIEAAASLRLTPGVEGGLLYIKRKIDRKDYPFEGQVEVQSGAVPFAGVFFRPEYTFGKERGFTLSLEVALDLLLASLGGNKVTENFNAKALGGVGYAF
jgi:hypothetical protein